MFIAWVALWPVLGRRVMGSDRAEPFREWIAYQASVMIVMMVLIYSVNKYIEVKHLLGSL
jgi:hypothetical protein